MHRGAVLLPALTSDVIPNASAGGHETDLTIRALTLSVIKTVPCRVQIGFSCCQIASLLQVDVRSLTRPLAAGAFGMTSGFSSHHLRNSYEPVTLGAVPRNQAIHSFHGFRPVCPKCSVASIVK